MFQHLKWEEKIPTVEGWYFVWSGTKGMTIQQIVPRYKPDQQTVIGGRWDGINLASVESLEARLWAGPLHCDPHKLPLENRIPPLLPQSECDLVKEWKRLHGELNTP